MFDSIKQYLSRFSWPVWTAMTVMLVIGILAVRVAESVDPAIEGYARRQMLFAAVGMLGFFVATIIPYQRIGRYSLALFVGTLVLLVAVFFFPARRDCNRWIFIPGLETVSIQPSELAKLTFIISLAWYLRYRESYRRLRGLIAPFVLTMVPLGLIVMEPDLGTAMLLLPTLMVMLFMAGAKLRHLAVVVGLGVLVVFAPVPRAADQAEFESKIDWFNARKVGSVTFYSFNRPASGELSAWLRAPRLPVAYCRYRVGDGAVHDLQPLSVRVMSAMNKEYQVRRITGWLRPYDPRIRANVGFQQLQSIRILGAGRAAGQGDWNAVNTYFSMLPDDHTDFIFSIIGGQWGFVGCMLVLALYAVIFIFGADVAISTRDPFGRLLVMGVLALLAAQIFINVGMTMGLLPVTGMTLPLISYGGTSLLVNCVALGLLVNVAQRQPVSLAPKPFEFGRRIAPENRGRMSPVLPPRVIDGRHR